MLAWIGNISILFGYVLNFIYNIVGNYGLSIILFTLLVKLVLAPLTYLQQRGMKKTALISEELKKVQEKHKGNEKKIQEETMKVYKENNTSPIASCSSCFTVIIQMFLILAVFYLVSEPLKYMRKMDPKIYRQYEIRMYEEVIAEKEKEKEDTENKKEKTEEVKEDKKELKTEDKEKKLEKDSKKDKDKKEESKKDEKSEESEEEEDEDEKVARLRKEAGILRPQMEMISRFRDEDEAFDINTNFLGLDLTKIPTNSLKDFDIKDKDTYIVLTNLIIPILYISLSIANIIYTNKKMKKKEEDKDDGIIEVKAEKVVEKKTEEVKEIKDIEKDKLEAKESEKLSTEDFGDAMKDANKSMLYFMPILMFTVTMNAPLSLALYWLSNTLLSFIERYGVEKLVDFMEIREANNKELEKSKKK